MNKEIIDGIVDDITILAKTLFKTKSKQAVKDGKAFLNQSKKEVKIWLNQLATGEITQKNFESLVRGERDLAKMEALKQAGLARVSIDTFTRGIIEIIINGALKAI